MLANVHGKGHEIVYIELIAVVDFSFKRGRSPQCRQASGHVYFHQFALGQGHKIFGGGVAASFKGCPATPREHLSPACEAVLADRERVAAESDSVVSPHGWPHEQSAQQQRSQRTCSDDDSHANHSSSHFACAGRRDPLLAGVCCSAWLGTTYNLSVVSWPPQHRVNASSTDRFYERCETNRRANYLDTIEAGESWWDRTLRDEPRPSSEPEPGRRPRKPAPPRSSFPASLASLPSRSRKPGGARREGQRSGSRKLPVPTEPVNPWAILELMRLRWRGKHEFTTPWRMRSLAVLAVALAAPSGTTITAMCQMSPGQVMGLSMPRVARNWVRKWLRLRQHVFGPVADSQPWLTYADSRGMPRQVGWSSSVALSRGGLPAWRLGKVLASSWPRGT